MKTHINDDFALDELECTYFDICRNFDSSQCKYGTPCTSMYFFNGRPIITLRRAYKKGLEPYVSLSNLEEQIKMIIEDEK